MEMAIKSGSAVPVSSVSVSGLVSGSVAAVSVAVSGSVSLWVVGTVRFRGGGSMLDRPGSSIGANLLLLRKDDSTDDSTDGWWDGWEKCADIPKFDLVSLLIGLPLMPFLFLVSFWVRLGELVVYEIVIWDIYSRYKDCYTA